VDPRFLQLMARMMTTMAEGAEAAEKMWSGLRQALGSAEQYAKLMAELSKFKPPETPFAFGSPLSFDEFQQGFSKFNRSLGWVPASDVEDLKEKIAELEKKLAEKDSE
jgi:hypothetical protein